MKTAMTFQEILDRPTSIDVKGLHEGIFHESLFRSYQIVEKVKELCELNTNPSVILEVIEHLRDPKVEPYSATGSKEFHALPKV